MSIYAQEDITKDLLNEVYQLDLKVYGPMDGLNLNWYTNRHLDKSFCVTRRGIYGLLEGYILVCGITTSFYKALYTGAVWTDLIVDPICFKKYDAANYLYLASYVVDLPYQDRGAARHLLNTCFSTLDFIVGEGVPTIALATKGKSAHLLEGNDFSALRENKHYKVMVRGNNPTSCSEQIYVYTMEGKIYGKIITIIDGRDSTLSACRLAC